jgi:hypothetical protein
VCGEGEEEEKKVWDGKPETLATKRANEREGGKWEGREGKFRHTREGRPELGWVGAETRPERTLDQGTHWHEWTGDRQARAALVW